MTPVRFLATTAAGALLACTACSVGTPPADGPVADVTVHGDDGLYGAVMPDPYEASDLELTGTDGRPARLDRATELAGDELTLVFFGYTHCPDICQVVMADIASALTRLPADQREKVGMRFVTTDPSRDDAETLREYLDRFDPTFEGLTGPLPRIIEVADSIGVSVEKGRRMPSGGYEVEHGTHVVGVLPDGTAPVVWTEGTGPDRIAQDLGTILTKGVPEVSGS